MECLICKGKLRETSYNTMSTDGLPKKYAEMVRKFLPRFYRCHNCGDNLCYLVFPDGVIFAWGGKGKPFRWYHTKGIIPEKVVFT